MEKVYRCRNLITHLRNITDKLSDFRTNDIGIVQYPRTETDGVVRLPDVSLSGIGAFIISATNSDSLTVKWYSVRANPMPGSTGYFSTGSFSILWNLSSVAYGWAILMSDNDNMIVFGRLVSGVWYWYKPTLTVVS